MKYLLVLGFAGCCTPALAQQPLRAAAALDHVALYVQDADRSARFYQSVFGLKQVPAPVPFARWLVLSNGTMLHLVAGRPTPVTTSNWEHVALACDDMRRMIATLDAQGIKWADNQGKPQPLVRADGVQQIFIQDPDGYWIEINDALKQK